MASETSRGEPEEGAIQIFRLDRSAFLWRDVGRIVTFVASETGVLAFQKIAGFLVIERLRIPLDEREILAIVLGVASGALLA